MTEIGTAGGLVIVQGALCSVLRTHCPAAHAAASQPRPLTVIGSSGGDGGSSGGGGGSGGSGGRCAIGAWSVRSTHLRSNSVASVGMAQSMHTVAFSPLYFPAGQKLQSSVLVPALYFPASHAVHLPSLALAWQ